MINIQSITAACKVFKKEGIRRGCTYIRKRAIAKTNGYPNTLTFETAAVCNIRCVFCYIYKNPPVVCKRPFLPLELFKKVVSETEHFLEDVVLHWRGEPLLNKDLPLMVRFATERGIRANFNTNALALTEERSKALIDAKLAQMIICMDGVTKDVYETHRCGSDFETVVGNVARLVELKRQMRSRLPQVKLQMTVTKKNQHQTEGFEKLARKLGVDSAHLLSLYIDHTAPEAFVKSMVDDYFVDSGEPGLSRYFVDDKGKMRMYSCQDTSCPQDARWPIITTDGDICECCYDTFIKNSFGNCEKRSFTELWNDPGYRDFRRTVMMNRKLAICKNCFPKYREWVRRLF